MKTCKWCGESKPADEYYSHPHTSDRLSPQCKECLREYQRKRHARRQAERKTPEGLTVAHGDV